MTHTIALVVAAALAGTAQDKPRSTDMTTATTIEKNKETVRRLYQECLDQGALDRVAELVAAEYVGASGERGPAGMTATLAALRGAFPDIHFTLEDLIAAGDRVVVRWTWKGTHQGRFRELAASHKTLSNSGMAIYQLAGGKMIRSWLQTDRLGLLQQLGALP